MTMSSILLLLLFLLIFAVGMRSAGKAQTKAKKKAQLPSKPLPPPLKDFPSERRKGYSCNPSRLGTLAITGYVAASTISRIEQSQGAAEQTDTGADVADNDVTDPLQDLW